MLRSLALPVLALLVPIGAATPDYFVGTGGGNVVADSPCGLPASTGPLSMALRGSPASGWSVSLAGSPFVGCPTSRAAQCDAAGSLFAQGLELGDCGVGSASGVLGPFTADACATDPCTLHGTASVTMGGVHYWGDVTLLVHNLAAGA